MFRNLIGRGREALHRLPTFSTRKPNRPAHFFPHLEPLERRYALSCAAINQAGVLEINPDPGGDTITLDHLLVQNTPTTRVTQVTCQNGVLDFDDSLITGQEIDFKPPTGGDDIINIERTVAAIWVKMDLGSGHDTINFSPTAMQVQNLQVSSGKPLTVNGSNTGTATLNFDDRMGPGSVPGEGLLANSFQYNGVEVVHFTMPNGANTHYMASQNGVALVLGTPSDVPPPSGCICFEIDLGPGINIIEAENTAVFTPVMIFSGGGTDTVNISPTAGDLDTIQGSVGIIGSPGSLGSTTINIFDQNNPSNSTWTITNGSVSRAGMAPISYSNIQGIMLSGGAAAVIYNIESTAAGTSVQIDQTGFGDNSVVLSPTAHQLATIAGAVTVNGNYGFDALVLDDAAAGSSTTYAITDNAAAVDNLPGFTLAHFLMNELNVLTIADSTVCNLVSGTAPQVKKNGVIVAPRQCSGPGPNGGPTGAEGSRKPLGHCGCSADTLVTRAASTNGAPVVSTTTAEPGLTAPWRQAGAPGETGAITIAAMPEDLPKALGRVLWYLLAKRNILVDTEGEDVFSWALNQE